MRGGEERGREERVEGGNGRGRRGRRGERDGEGGRERRRADRKNGSGETAHSSLIPTLPHNSNINMYVSAIFYQYQTTCTK